MENKDQLVHVKLQPHMIILHNDLNMIGVFKHYIRRGQRFAAFNLRIFGATTISRFGCIRWIIRVQFIVLEHITHGRLSIWWPIIVPSNFRLLWHDNGPSLASKYI